VAVYSAFEEVAHGCSGAGSARRERATSEFDCLRIMLLSLISVYRSTDNVLLQL
jgi:hypothetical protein